jgi:DNA-binding NtrC family response regulator
VSEKLDLESTVPVAPARALDLRTIVRVVSGRASPTSVPLLAACRIGTGSDCNIVLSDRTVSRVHVELIPTSQGIEVRDLGSRNGTFYLDQRIKEVVLAPGARIRVGDTIVAIDVDNDALHTRLTYSGGELYGTMLGRSHAMHQLFALLDRLRNVALPVLIHGESGVGKEEVARTLHAQSPVAAGPIVTLNCGAIPRELVGSELFGHRRGAFTGATEARKGAFESAHGGTVFLDEIGELPLEIQPMLLRVLESGEVRRVGDDAAHRVNVRVMAAPHRDIEEDVRAGLFREDLFYRLAVIRLTVPPLRDRRDDIALLAQKFANDAGHAGALPVDVIEQLKARPWSGNVRELRNVVASYVALGVLPPARRTKPGSLAQAYREMVDLDVPYADQKASLVDAFTAIYLEMLLDTCGGNRSAAAKRAGLDRNYFRELLEKHGLAKR